MGSDLLEPLLRVNVAGSVAILAILAARPALRRFGAGVAYAAWLVVPLAAAASLLPPRTVTIEAPVSAVTAAAPAAAPSADLPLANVAVAPDPGVLMASVWALGAIACLALLAWRQARFGRRLGRLTREAGVWRAQRPGVGPVVVGAIWPRIVLPADFEARFSPEERAFVLAHERTHLRRGDPLTNGFVAALQCLNWFNPLAHVAAHYVRLDQELACDAAVVGGRPEARRGYAEAMLKTQLEPLAAPLGCHWPARGLNPLKLRIASLQAPAPSAVRRGLGFAAVSLAGASAAAVAWAAQPPRVVQVVTQVSGEAVATADLESLRKIAEVRAVPRKPAKAPAPEGAAPRGFRFELAEDLMRAARRDDPAVAEALIAAGANPNHFQPGDGTPLLQAARRDHVATMRVLLAHGAQVNQAAPGDGNALIGAARAGQIRAARLLVERGADVNAFVMGDETPLINAARSDDLSMVKFLVEHGADVNLAVPANAWGRPMRSPLGSASAPSVKAYLRAQGARS